MQLEAAGNTLTIRADVPADEKDTNGVRYEQSFTIPPFLDLDKLTASHQHGMLRLSMPIKDSVKPRRIQIDATDDQRRLVGAS